MRSQIEAWTTEAAGLRARRPRHILFLTPREKTETKTGNWRHSAVSGTNFGGGWNFCSKTGANRERRTTMGKKGFVLCVCQGTCAKLCPGGAIRFPDEATFSTFIKERIARQAMKG